MDSSRTLTIEVLASTSVEAKTSELRNALQRADPAVTAFVFVAPGTATSAQSDQSARIAAMVDQVSDQIPVVLDRAPATSAVKRVENGLVVQSLDRDRLCRVVPPAVLERSALERALAGAAPSDLGPTLRPVELLASSGARISIIGI